MWQLVASLDMKLPNFELQIKGKLSMTQMMILIINYVHPKIIPAKTSWYLDIEVWDVLQWKVEVLRWQSWPLLRTDHRAVAFTEVLKGASWLDLMVTRVLSWRQELKLAFKKLYFEFFGQTIFFPKLRATKNNIAGAIFDNGTWGQGLCRLGLEFFPNGPENIYLHQTK